MIVPILLAKTAERVMIILARIIVIVQRDLSEIIAKLVTLQFFMYHVKFLINYDQTHKWIFLNSFLN